MPRFCIVLMDIVHTYAVRGGMLIFNGRFYSYGGRHGRSCFWLAAESERQQYQREGNAEFHLLFLMCTKIALGVSRTTTQGQLSGVFNFLMRDAAAGGTKAPYQ